MEEPENRQDEKVQLHLVLPYKFQPASHPEVKAWLDRGYTIAQYQRVSDREVIVTFERATA